MYIVVVNWVEAAFCRTEEEAEQVAERLAETYDRRDIRIEYWEPGEYIPF